MYGSFLPFGSTIIFIIALLMIVFAFKIAKIKAGREVHRNDDNYIDYDLRLKKLEERIANLETIVLEKEREKKFSSL